MNEEEPYKRQKGRKKRPFRYFKFYCHEVFAVGRFKDWNLLFLQDDEKWCFVALRALCSMSDYQPLICVNPQVGYPDDWIAKTLRVPLDLWLRTKKKLEDNIRIKVEPNNLITIVEWNRYASPSYSSRTYRLYPRRPITSPLSFDDALDEKLPKPLQEERKLYRDTFKEVIEYLNKKGDRKFTTRCKAYFGFISGRMREGARLDDFKYVIDVKIKSWLGTEWERYLRPDTLFCASKFWGYRNEKLKAVFKKSMSDFHAVVPFEWKREYDDKKKKAMEKYGWKTEEEIDHFLFPTFTEFMRAKDIKAKEENK